MILHRSEVASPIGRLMLVAKGDALVAVAFEDYEREARRWLGRRFGELQMWDHPDPAGAASALRAYFEGDLTALEVGMRAARRQREVGRWLMPALCELAVTPCSSEAVLEPGFESLVGGTRVVGGR